MGVLGCKEASRGGTDTGQQHSSGAMEELSQKVQNANTHILRRRRSHEHAHNSRSFKGAMDEMS
jgi:hypothetical protein